MAATDAYLQFPLCLLGMSESQPWGERIQIVIAYSVMEYAVKINLLSLDDSELEVTTHCDEDSVMARLRAHFGIGNVPFSYVRELWQEGRAHVEKYRTSFPKSLGFVRLRIDVARMTLAGEMSEAEFRSLAAVYSAIGERPFAQVTFDQISWRAAGCVSENVYQTWHPNVQLYTRKQLRNIVDKLNDAEWFRSCVVMRRQKFYSHRLSEQQLRAEVQNMKAARARNTKRALRAELDRAMNAEIVARRAARSTGPHQGQSLGHFNSAGTDTEGQKDGHSVGPLQEN